MAQCKILFLAANPEGMSQLALDKEIREIDAKIRASDFRDSLQLVSHWAVRPDDLLQFLNQHKPHVVHFSGHGSEENEILLLSETGNSQPVSSAALRELFRTLKDNIRVVVFNACFSRGQAEAIVENIDCAVGMNKAIGDQAAITFAASFYRALGFGRSVQQAFDQGKTALMLAGIREEHIPELLCRSGVDPNGIVLVQAATPTTKPDSERREPEEPASAELGPNPYMGLSAFHEEDADRFFGRETQITRLWEKLRDLHQDSSQRSATPRLLPILGPSGSGKSSVARAGLIPELARRPLPGYKDSRIAVLTPGSHPVEALAGVLARIATGDSTPVEKTEEFERVLKRQSDLGEYEGLRRIADALPEIASLPLIVLIDQFEEIYALCEGKSERTAFIENLLHAASDRSGRVSVVLTLRTDFLDKTQTHESLHGIICTQAVIIPAMNEQELRWAITKPAELAGKPLDRATVELLVKDTKDHEGTLPMMQFALTRIWEGFVKGKEAAATYDEIGGVGGALAGEAQRIYDRLNNEEQDIAKRVFLGLVQLGEGTRDTRRRVAVNQLVTAGEDPSKVERVIDFFAHRKARLITLSSADQTSAGGATKTAEVTHEALFDDWDLLRDWIDENREGLKFKLRLGEAVREWEANARDDSYLYPGQRLFRAEEWSRRNAGELNQGESEFLAASRAKELASKLLETQQPEVVLGELSTKPEFAVPAIAKLVAKANYDSPLRGVESGTAIAKWLLHHGSIKALAGLLRHTRWPDLRTHLIHNLPKLGATPEMLIEQLDREHEISVRRALILTLTEFADDQFRQSEKRSLVKQLLQLYEHDFDPGIHAAAEFALRRFGHTVEMPAINLSLATGTVEANRRWYFTGQGQCLVLREDGDQLDHLPPGDRLAIASNLVTVEQFLEFRPGHDYRRNVSPEPTCPVNQVSWYDATAYCNWLSEREGVPEDQWCYMPNNAGKFAAGMAIASGFHRRSGYRLPSEHEWEYACRAGSEKGYCFGDSEKMLTNYACCSENSESRMFAVGSRKPNDIGIFDMHGNAWEWCQDMDSVDTTEKEAGDLMVDDRKGRVLRGGSFVDGAVFFRSAYRTGSVPVYRGSNCGFRVSRTYT